MLVIAAVSGSAIAASSWSSPKWLVPISRTTQSSPEVEEKTVRGTPMLLLKLSGEQVAAPKLLRRFPIKCFTVVFPLLPVIARKWAGERRRQNVVRRPSALSVSGTRRTGNPAGTPLSSASLAARDAAAFFDATSATKLWPSNVSPTSGTNKVEGSIARLSVEMPEIRMAGYESPSIPRDLATSQRVRP